MVRHSSIIVVRYVQYKISLTNSWYNLDLHTEDRQLKRGKKAKNVKENFGALKISAESFGDYSALVTNAFCFNWSDRIQRHLMAVKEKVCRPMRMLSHWALFVSTNQMTLSSELWSKFSDVKWWKWICCTVYSASHLYWDNPCSFRQSSSTVDRTSQQPDLRLYTTTTDHVRQI